MAANFSYYDVSFKKHEIENRVYVTGEILNNSFMNYALAFFRITLFMENTVLATGTIKIAGLASRKTRIFETTVDGVPEFMIDRITRWEIIFDSGY